MAESQPANPVRRGAAHSCPDCGADFFAGTKRGTNAVCCEACQLKRLTNAFTAGPRITLPAEAKKPWHRSRKAWAWLLVFAAVVTAAIVWRQAVRDLYHRWSQNMHASRAERNFTKGDYEHAILDGRRALELDPLDVETNRIIAKSCEAQGLPDAIAWRMRLNFIKPGDAENALAWARDTLNIGDLDSAEDALAVLRPGDRESAAYHDIAARLAMGRGDSVNAQTHWSESVRLDPASEDYRLKLSTLELRSRSESTRAAAAKKIAALGEIPAHRLTALRALIEDAMNHGESQQARTLADRLVASPDARFIDRIGRLSVLRAQDAVDAPQYIEQLRDESLRDPVQFSALLHWMNENGLPLLASDWAQKLPPDLITKPPVSLVVAESHGRNRDWEKLRVFVVNAAWNDQEHVRLAYLSLALENLRNVVAAETMWGRAIAECHERPSKLAVLVRLAQTWRWDARVESTLKKLSADASTPLWVLDALWAVARKSGDAEELQRLSKLIVALRPKNPVARNNYIRLTLLRRINENAPHRLALDLFNERPKDITCATTHALSLFFQDRIFDALKVMQEFPPEELREPEAAFYYAVFLQASGDSEKAGKFHALSRGAALMHDEEELFLHVKRESRFNTLTPAQKNPELKGK